jgi:chemotaxis protein MotA
MFVIVGWILALGCIFGVYIVHGGNIQRHSAKRCLSR